MQMRKRATLVYILRRSEPLRKRKAWHRSPRPREARSAWLLANPGIGHDENQQLRDGSLLPARTLQAGIRGREEARLGLLALKRLDQFRAVQVCVVDGQPALGESINI